ncbi:TetR/AcrR family transcriptional regulator [Pedococcus sp. NPDC057267]|uniref:TetR/AcrR family transcriptional regulator n=1 Tax=Pedococcus sp. NPDC057267 TaxID=3346077 RepID=UPI00363C6A5A
MTTTSVDGRSVLRAERRQAILTATRELVASAATTHITVEQVAERAGVSRRTVFNHFGSFDALLVAVCEEVLADVTAQVLDDVARRTRRGEASDQRNPNASLDALCEAVRGADLPTAMVSIDRLIGGLGGDETRVEAISQSALDQVGRRVATAVLSADPGLDPLTLDLTVAFLMNGVGVLAHRWLEQSGARLTPATRGAWTRSMSRLLRQIRSGYTTA